MFVSSRFDHERRHADLDSRRVRWQREKLKAYANYDNHARTHLALEKDPVSSVLGGPSRVVTIGGGLGDLEATHGQYGLSSWGAQ
jgi:hypothetical protein